MPEPGVPDRLEFRRVDPGHPDARLLIDEVQAEYVVRYGNPDQTPVEEPMFHPPQGSFFVAYLDGVPVASGAWRRRNVAALGSTETAEVKRMYVVPAARRRGIARRMLAHLEASAAAAGFGVVVLETGSMQPEAIALYTACGYEPIPPFGYYRDHPGSQCFARAV